MRFVKEYQLKQRRDVIGQNYRLRSASRLSQLLVKTLTYARIRWLFRLTGKH